MMTQPLPYCTYVLFSDQDRMLYVGFSSNLENRLIKHNSGGVKSTAYRRPLKLIFAEFYLFENDARSRELYFKTTAGKKALKLMLRSTLHTLGYAEKVAFIFEDGGLIRRFSFSRAKTRMREIPVRRSNFVSSLEKSMRSM